VSARDSPVTTDHPWYARPVASSIPVVDVIRCPACESERRKLKYEVVEHEYDNTTDDVFKFQECDGCGAWYLDPRPAVSALDIIYPPNYYTNVQESQAEGVVDQVSHGMFGVVRRYLFRQQFAPIAKHKGLNAETRCLDVGCGSGVSLNAMRQAFGMSGMGIDYSERAASLTRARGFDARACRFEDFDPGDQRFDLVHSSHVIEHVETPLDYMHKTYEILNPGGLCAFFTPNIDTWEAERFGRHWGGLHVPRHWTLFGPESARKMGEKAGFEFLEASYSVNGMFWTWSFHSWLQERFGRTGWNDAIFRSDHRFTESSIPNMIRTASLLPLDIINMIFQKRTCNMLVVFRKP
jgi:2-polyprenyl-3-methyl-5-hydroxy-6-metoxy-1,4-benzoquinol methylase